MGECLIMRRGGETYRLPILNESYPQDVTKTVIKGSTTSATFSVQIAEAGNPAEYTYQWYVNGSAVSGATSSSYTKSDLSETATYTVYCEVTNKAGVVTSRVATLKVTQYYTPVLNTSYPANVTGATVGGSATFKVTIATDGYPASYTYQWYVNGSAVSGATSASYTISSLAKGTYTVYCKVTNTAGTVTSRTATLTVTTLYLYNSGDACTSVSGGWNKLIHIDGAGDACSNLTVTNTGAVLKLTKTATSWSVAHTGNMIDLTSYDTIYFEIQKNDWKYADSHHYVCIFNAIDTSGATSYSTSASTETTYDTAGIYSIDVSSYSGKYYVGFLLTSITGSESFNIEVSKVYLE